MFTKGQVRLGLILMLALILDGEHNRFARWGIVTQTVLVLLILVAFMATMIQLPMIRTAELATSAAARADSRSEWTAIVDLIGLGFLFVTFLAYFSSTGVIAR